VKWFRGPKDPPAEEAGGPAQASPGAVTVGERRALTAARQEAARERDAERYELVGGVASRVTIPRELGFSIVPRGGLRAAGAVVDAANALIDGIGHDTLAGGAMGKLKGGFLAKGFLPADDLTLDSPYLAFALDDEIVGPSPRTSGSSRFSRRSTSGTRCRPGRTSRAARSSGTWITPTRPR
jgi:hypothetical protein